MTNSEQVPTVVVLRHSTPDGGAHFDWLLLPPEHGNPSPDERVLLSFRCPARPDELPPGGVMAVEPMSPHRARYLDAEGELSGGRGAVRRVAAGSLREWRWDADGGVCAIRWHTLAAASPEVEVHRYELLRHDAGWHVHRRD